MSNPTCYPKTTLKHYMAGWTDAGESSVIESHLANCEICEQTLAELEGEPETLLEFLQGTGNNSAEQASDAPSQANDPLLSYALAKAKQIGSDPTSDSSDPAPVVSSTPTALGPYDLLRPIGQGSMGRVYLARHRQLGKLVAVKVFAARAFRSDETARRFEREVRAAGALHHPAIINATDAGQTITAQNEAVHYLVMEYIEGLDLSRLVRAVGRLSIADVCAIGQAMALGLDHAHAAGIVHRDIKPSNVMLSTSGQVKLLDFGLAQTTMWDEASAELTTVGQLMGTIDYMAPEQAERAESVDYRADLYALGATLFRLLCGRAPLAASPNLSPLARLRLLATSSPPALRTLGPDAPLELERLIHQLLSRQPEARPASAAHVAEQLVQWSNDANLSALIRTAQQATPATLDESTSADALQPAESLRSRQPPQRVGRWLMAAAAGAMALAAIVLITLETQKGQIVIESIDANVTVQLTKDGLVHKSLTVVPGANSTRIAAGQYDVSIATGSDQFAMDRETLEIKRGETVIARVRQAGQTPAVNGGQANTAQSIAVGEDDAKVYEGKTLATWRKELMRERSLESIGQALEAIAALADDQERSSILQEFMVHLPDMKDGELYNILEKVSNVARNSESYVDCLVKVLATVDDVKAAQLIHIGTNLLIHSRANTKDVWLDSIRPLALWSANFLRNDNQTTHITSDRARLHQTAGFCVVAYVNALRSAARGHQELEESMVDTLKSSKVLGDEFWMRVAPFWGETLSNKLATVLEERATTCFLTSHDAKQVILATLQLSLVNRPTYDRTGMPPNSRRAEIVEKIRGRLREFIEQPHKTTNYIDIDRELNHLLNTPPSISSKLMPRVKINTSNSGTNPCMDLLQLAANLNASLELADELTALVDKLKTPLMNFAVHGVGLRTSTIEFRWPQLQTRTTSMTSELSLTDELQPIQLSADEIMAAFVFSQVEQMLPKDKRLSLTRNLPEDIKQAWLDQQMKTYDLDMNEKVDANELPHSRVEDTDEDQALSRAEFQKFYNSVISRGPRPAPSER